MIKEAIRFIIPLWFSCLVLFGAYYIGSTCENVNKATSIGLIFGMVLVTGIEFIRDKLKE